MESPEMYFVCEGQNPQNAAPRAMPESLAEIYIYGPLHGTPADYFSSLEDAKAFAVVLRERLGVVSDDQDEVVFIMKWAG